MWLGILFGAIGLLLLAYSILPTCWCKLLHRLKRKKKGKTLYLTFDDGPDEQYTPCLLELLETYGVKASFFMVGDFVKQNPELVLQMKNQGHFIGLHSLKHRNALWQTPGYTERDFRESLEIMNTLGVSAVCYRPPWGHVNLAALKAVKKHKLHMVLWDVMAQDWNGSATIELIAGKLLGRTKANDIICLHDGRGKNEAPARTIKALERVLPLWIAEGYQFKTVDQYDKK